MFSGLLNTYLFTININIPHYVALHAVYCVFLHCNEFKVPDNVTQPKHILYIFTNINTVSLLCLQLFELLF